MTPVTTAPVKVPSLTVEYPMALPKLRQWLIDVATRRDVFREGKMQPLNDNEVIEVLHIGLKALKRLEEARAAERRGYLLNRFGTVLVGLDVAQPAEGDVIVVERTDGAREQCIVEGGSAWLWRNGSRGIKFCAVTKIVKWRACEMPEKPVVTETAKDIVMDALARGRALAGNGAGLNVQPGVSPHTTSRRKA